MRYVGTWQNQYGSVLKISTQEGERIAGCFRTALQDSGFFGREVPVTGLAQGECISFAFATRTGSGDMIASFTGRMWDGKLETMWFVVSTARPWPHAVQTNADTFARIGD